MTYVLGHIDAGIDCYNDRQLEQGEGLQGYESAIEEIHIPRKISKSYRRDLQSHGPFPRHLTSENKTMASVGVKGEASAGTADTTSSHHRSPRKLHLETKSAMAVLDPNGPRTRGPHASKPRTGRARETNGRTQMAQLTRAIACLLTCLLAGEAQRRWGSGGAAAYRACVNVSSSVGRESGRGRCNILVVHVGGQRAQN